MFWSNYLIKDPQSKKLTMVAVDADGNLNASISLMYIFGFLCVYNQ